MRDMRILAALGLIAAAGAANAGVASTWTATNDYDFRGISQTAQSEALQASLDYASDFGWYAGAWASNVDFGDDTSNEIDLYTGFSGTAGSFGYDAGIVWYTYDESIYSYPEIYVSGTIGPFKGKIWYSNEFAGVNFDPGSQTFDTDSESAFYVEGNLTLPVNDTFSFLAHVGYSGGDYWDEVGDAATLATGSKVDGEYIDYSVGVSAAFGKFTTTFKFVDTDADIETTGKLFNNDRRVVLSIATTFPWAD